jgi:hypothetical protein
VSELQTDAVGRDSDNRKSADIPRMLWLLKTLYPANVSATSHAGSDCFHQFFDKFTTYRGLVKATIKCDKKNWLKIVDNTTSRQIRRIFLKYWICP